jgi:hypothetical protein
MDWNITANSITSLSTLGTMGVAGYALYTWRREFIGKKKIELASEIMMTVMDFQDVLISARIEGSVPMELDEVKKWLEEVNSKKQNIPNAILWPIYPDRLHCLLPIHRLNKSAEKIDAFSAIANKSLIYFGEELYKLLIELHSALGKIRYASEMLYENPNNTELQQVAFAHNTDNPVFKRISEIGDEIKLNLEPLYKYKQSSWKKLT